MNKVKVKEAKFRVTTEKHDLDTKVNHIRRWLTDGHKVKLVVQMRGREQQHPKVALSMLDVVLACIPHAEYQVEKDGKVEGRLAQMVIRPGKKKR